MFFKYLVLIFAIIAVAAGKLQNENDKKKTKVVPFEDTVKQRVVRLYDAEGAWKGTGYIVTAEALITPSTNLKKYAGTMKFMLRTKSNREVREIGPNEPYNKFLSVALFHKVIKPGLQKYFPEVPFLIVNKNSLIPNTMRTVGFAESNEKRMVEYGLIKVDYEEKIYHTSSTVKLKVSPNNPNNKEHTSSQTVPDTENDPNCFQRIMQSTDVVKNAYSPQVGDVLITRDRVAGILVRFQRNAGIVSGEYCFYTEPPTTVIESLKGAAKQPAAKN